MQTSFSSANMSSLKHSIACFQTGFPNTPVICQSSTKPLPLFEAELQNKQQFFFCAMESQCLFTLASGLNNPVLNCFQIPHVTKAETTDLGGLAFHQKVHFLLNHILKTAFTLTLIFFYVAQLFVFIWTLLCTRKISALSCTINIVFRQNLSLFLFQYLVFGEKVSKTLAV